MWVLYVPPDLLKFFSTKLKPTGKRQKVLQGKHVVCMEMSNSCCALMGVDRAGSVCLFRIRPMLGQSVDQGEFLFLSVSTLLSNFGDLGNSLSLLGSDAYFCEF